MDKFHLNDMFFLNLKQFKCFKFVKKHNIWDSNLKYYKLHSNTGVSFLNFKQNIKNIFQENKIGKNDKNILVANEDRT